jgi:hypothetical protein
MYSSYCWIYIDFAAINVEIKQDDEILKVEVFVQIVEFMFYVWLIFYFRPAGISNGQLDIINF